MGASTGIEPFVESCSGTCPHLRLDSGGMRPIGLAVVLGLSFTLAPPSAAMTRERSGGLLVVSDPIFDFHGARLSELEVKSRLPAMYGLRSQTEAGGLIELRRRHSR